MSGSREDRLRYQKYLERVQGWLTFEKYEEAALALERIPAAYRQDTSVLIVRLELHLKTGQYAEAEPIARHLVEALPGEPQYWIGLAFATRRAKSIVSAEKILREARTRFPDCALVWFNLACYASQEGRFAEVRELLDEAGRLEPDCKVLAVQDPDFEPYWRHLGRRIDE
jgi:Flp pilus assembly protein TadD